MVEIKLKYGMAVAETVGADIGQRFLCLLAMSAELVGSGAVVARILTRSPALCVMTSRL